jgi:3-dehydroquinate synthase
MHDKKVRDGGITFVFNKGVGDFHLDRVTDIPALLRSCGIGG